MNFTRFLAAIFGIVFILVGLAGFLPKFTTAGNLLGIFEIDDVHNIIHLLTGIIAFFAASKLIYARLYFQIFGIIYLIVGILGFALNGNLILMHVNIADNFLHLLVAIIALYIGFFYKRPKPPMING